MTPSADLVAQFDREFAITGTVLSRVLTEDWDWRPHPRSLTMGELATHIANLLTWTGLSLAADQFDMAPEGEGPRRNPPAADPEEMRTRFETNAREARQALAAATDAQLRGSWTLAVGGRTVFTMPRTEVLRSFVLHHLIHHRGQLTVYLRLRDRPVPAVYGRSADEQPSF